MRVYLQDATYVLEALDGDSLLTPIRDGEAGVHNDAHYGGFPYLTIGDAEGITPGTYRLTLNAELVVDR